MNNQIFFFFYNLAHRSAFVDWLIVFFANIFPFLVVIFAGLFLLFHHEILQAEEPFKVFMEKKKEFMMMFFSVFSAYILSVILKLVIHTPRPLIVFSSVQSLFTESSFAFPSGHATFFFALAFSIFFLHKKAGYIFMFFALLISLARITAGVHFPVDILGGFILGGIVSYLVAFFTKNVYPHT